MSIEAVYDPLKRQFAGAVEALKKRYPEVTQWSGERAGPWHAQGFTAAGIMQTEVLHDIKAMVNEAQDQGVTLSEFRKQFVDAARNKGWQVRGVSRSDKYMAWRAKLIFNTSMRSSVMAGRWVQIQKTKAAFAFLQYNAVLDKRTRKEHRAWNGIVRHVDDAFWHSHYPPNGYLCRCTVIQLSQRMVDQQGLRVATDPFKTPYRNVRDADGQVVDQVPVGIDQGWDTNVGVASSAPELALGRKVLGLSQSMGAGVVDQVMNGRFLDAVNTRWQSFFDARQPDPIPDGFKPIKPSNVIQVVGFLDSKLLSGLAELVPDLELKNIVVGAVDVDTKHIRGLHRSEQGIKTQTWPAAMIRDLSLYLSDYRAAYWDTEKKTILVIPKVELHGRPTKITLTPNYRRTNQSNAAFDGFVSVTSLGAADLSNFDAKKYVRLAGSLK